MKIMRLRHAKLIATLVILFNLILLYYCWKSMLWKSLTGDTLLPIMSPISLEHMAHNEQEQINGAKTSKGNKVKNTNKHLRKSITIIFRNVYNYENDLTASIDSILEVIPNIQILVLQEGSPYPPLTYDNNNTVTGAIPLVRFINLGFDITKTPAELNPLLTIRTKYALFMPDSVRLSNKSLLQKILREINSKEASDGGGGGDGVSPKANSNYANQKLNFKETSKNRNPPSSLTDSRTDDDYVRRHIIIVPFAGNVKAFSSCTQILLDMPNWTIQYVVVNNSEECDLYLQKHAILVDIGVLKDMPDPIASPFPEMFYIQAKLAEITNTIFPQYFQDGRRLFTSYHTKQRRLENRRRQFKELYKKLQIKRIIRRTHKANGANVDARGDKHNKVNNNINNNVEVQAHHFVLDTQFSSSNLTLPYITEIDLIGCERTSKSCIGNVYNNRPFYVYLGRHTPPCCLDKLRKVFNHVFEEFENVGIRYWLDNYALRSAIETNQLSPDAYEIDVSFNVNDLKRSNALKKSQTIPFTDNDGFYWIKATDGHYFRAQFSKINQIGVNLLPFETNGNEVKPSGFFGWKAKDFPADFLHPMSTVLFLGKNIMCPNNVREFLEFKNIK